MGSVSRPRLHIVLFPFMAAGHMIPLLDVARLFAARNVRTTVLTTPANAHILQPSVDRANATHPNRPPITLSLLPFPSTSFGLPDGCENMADLPTPGHKSNFVAATATLRLPFNQLLADIRPDAVVTDMFLPWTTDSAAAHGIPRLIFHGTSLFALSARAAIDRNPTDDSETETILVPGLPHRIEILRSQMPDSRQAVGAFKDLLMAMRESELKSFGVVVNSFSELEPDYVAYYRDVVGLRPWLVGPVSLCNEDEADKSTRGGGGAACLEWLDGQTPGSVVYVCFGSMGDFTVPHLREIADGLAAAGHPFIWVVKNRLDWVPEEYDRGMVIIGWAPQILILNHPAVGGFVTHCGWNSALEGVTAGVPLVTWPLFADQFFNEKLLVEVLGVGVAVGVRKYSMGPEDRQLITAAEVERAVRQLMDNGEEAEERRRRARELGNMAKKAVEDGGSSSADMENLIQELMDRPKGVSS